MQPQKNAEIFGKTRCKNSLAAPSAARNGDVDESGETMSTQRASNNWFNERFSPLFLQVSLAIGTSWPEQWVVNVVMTQPLAANDDRRIDELRPGQRAGGAHCIRRRGRWGPHQSESRPGAAGTEAEDSHAMDLLRLRSPRYVSEPRHVLIL
ncbi:hypothetical protein G7Z17_g7338 [Cylindrodendrum hubeiense]|uniref:Uncharacterized protein n=1 Tax=Cylindrodendrum hubeiense TaxID=595255 RepID=A0A9P5L7G1_9HYPO|nr:hypothetical protein G7Z17_g7338 [Cylindrodendrum hubeiense]